MKNFRRNEGIRAPRLRVVDNDGEQLGVLSREEALAIAQERGLDLIEVSPAAEPPVCRIDDFGSFTFNKQKAEKKQKLASKQAVLKSIRFGIRISAHDLEVKSNHARKFLEKHHPVKVLLQFKGREATHESLGLEKMNAFAASLKDVSTPESTPRRQGNRISFILRPEKPKKPKISEND